MARPVKSRDAKAYKRDIEQLNRLRMAVIMDDSIDSVKANEIGILIDSLVVHLVKLSRKVAA